MSLRLGVGRLPWGATAAVVLLVVATVSAACSQGRADGSDRSTVRVMAAASLGAVLLEAADDLAALDPPVTLELVTAGSSTLREQLSAGAPADLFVPAQASGGGYLPEGREFAAEPVVVARNTLSLAVPRGNPQKVTGLADLERRELLVGLCAPQVPCGAAAQQWLEAAGVTAQPDTLELNVSALAERLAADELDVGLVYRSDVVSRPNLEAVPPKPGDSSPPMVSYPAAVLADAANPRGTQQLVRYLLSPLGQELLAAHGFEAS